MKKVVIGIAFLLVVLFVADHFIFNNTTKTDLTEQSADSSETVNASAEYGLQTGEKAPDFTLETLSGETLTLSELQGKKVLLNFWASWCGPCREEMPALESVYQQYKDQDIIIVSVNMTIGKETKEKAAEFANEFGLTFPIPLDTKDEVRKLYQIYGLPTSYFIDTTGIIQSVYFGPMDENYIIEQFEKMS